MKPTVATLRTDPTMSELVARMTDAELEDLLATIIPRMEAARRHNEHVRNRLRRADFSDFFVWLPRDDEERGACAGGRATGLHMIWCGERRFEVFRTTAGSVRQAKWADYKLIGVSLPSVTDAIHGPDFNTTDGHITVSEQDMVLIHLKVG